MKQKIYKLYSIVLTLAMVLSMCVCAIGTASASEATYYVSPDGDDTADGTSVSTPVATVDQAIKLANAAGYGEGDTVYVKVIHVADKNTTWVTSGSQITAHTFTLDISSYGEKAQIGDGVTTTFNGPAVISNITFGWNKDNYPTPSFDGNDITVGEGVSTTGSMYNLHLAKSGTFDKDITLKFTGAFSKGFFLGGEWSGPVFNGDINLILDGAGAYSVNLGTNNGNGAPHVTKFNGNINFNLKNASGLNLGMRNANQAAFGANSSVQIINSVGVSSDAWVTALTSTTAVVPPKYYIINNKTGDKDAVEFTDTAGKYKINLDSKYTLLIDGEEAVLDGEYVTLDAGVHNFTITKEPETYTYYISGSGSDDNDGSKAAPFKTVEAAINAGNALKLIDCDTVNAIVVDDTSWFQDTKTSAAGHIFKLNVNSPNPTIKPTVSVTNYISFSGDTFIDNIIFTGFGQWNSSFFNDSDVTFGPGAVFSPYELAFGSYNNGNTVPGQTVIINNAMSLRNVVRVCNGGNGYKTYSEDINVFVNNAAANIKFSMTQDWGHGVTFEKNVNFYINDASAVSLVKSFKNGYNPTVTAKGAFQFIIDKPQNTDLPEATVNYMDSVSPECGYYVAYNKSGIPGLLSFTEYGGEYFVDDEMYIVKATDKNGNETFAQDGILALPDWGEYDITATEKEAVYQVYYVQNGSQGGTGEESAPFGSVAEAIAGAKAAGLSKIDHLNVKLLDDAPLGSLPEYKFAVTVESADDKAALTVDSDIANGKTVYKNITLNGSSLDFGESEVTLEDDVSFNGTSLDVTNAKAVINAALASAVIEAEDNVELVINNAQSKANITFADTTYGDVKVDIKAADQISFSGDITAAGTVELIINDSAEVSGLDFDSVVSNGKWLIYDKSGYNGGIRFTENAGDYKYLNGREVELVGESSVYGPVNAVITAPTGVYDFIIKTQADKVHADHIVNRGQGLKNIYAKLSKGEPVNIVYFGGSVTVGTGSTAGGSWRERIGNWIEDTFSDAEVNNISAAYGGTGTWFGMYRLRQEVLSKNPDLIFVEYSINDFYNRFSNEQAAKQYETIVRQIREEFPECDIINVLTTEKSMIDSLIANDTLHGQAQAHDNIAKEYDIPTIRVGHALADHLNTVAGSAWLDVWSEYMTDIVHPTNAGYDVYYETIKEYLADQLVYGEHDGTIKEHTVPELVSDILYDGDVQYIDANQDLENKSFYLGGTGFAYNAMAGGYRGDFIGGSVSQSGDSSKYILKFTGTELAMLHTGSDFTGFSIKIDGQTKTVNVGIGPTVLVKGLEPTEHTIEISPISASEKTASLTICGFFVRNERKATHNHKYGSYVNDNNATCEENATETATCELCGNPDTRVIPNSKSAHTYDDSSDMECNVCGETRVLGSQFIKEGGEYYYYKDGVKSTDTALVKVNGKWFYIEEGRWNKEFTDLHKLNGKWFYVKNGRWSPINDLVKYKGKWFFVRGGKWFSSDNTLFKKNGKWFSIQWGKWSKSTCIITYKGSKFYCKGGFAQLGFTGKAKVGSKTYTVVKGKIK